MNDLPTVTIITPTYDRHVSLREALQSVQRQTFRAYEHLVVADSHDAVVEQMLTNVPRTRYLHSETRHNDWGHTLRNVGLAEVRSEFVCCLDDDNLYHPRYLEKMLKAVSSGAGYAVCNIIHPGHSGGVMKPSIPPVIRFVDHLCFVIRTELVRRVGGWKTSYAADFTLIDAVSRISEGVLVPEVLATYRRLPGDNRPRGSGNHP